MQISRPEDIGALIKSKRLSRGWDQQELADRLGTNRRWIWSIESGKPNIRLTLVLRALAELDIKLLAINTSPSNTVKHSQEPESGGDAYTIDIDAIADMGLNNE